MGSEGQTESWDANAECFLARCGIMQVDCFLSPDRDQLTGWSDGYGTGCRRIVQLDALEFFPIGGVEQPTIAAFLCTDNGQSHTVGAVGEIHI